MPLNIKHETLKTISILFVFSKFSFSQIGFRHTRNVLVNRPIVVNEKKLQFFFSFTHLIRNHYFTNLYFIRHKHGKHKHFACHIR